MVAKPRKIELLDFVFSKKLSSMGKKLNSGKPYVVKKIEFCQILNSGAIEFFGRCAKKKKPAFVAVFYRSVQPIFSRNMRPALPLIT